MAIGIENGANVGKNNNATKSFKTFFPITTQYLSRRDKMPFISYYDAVYIIMRCNNYDYTMLVLLLYKAVSIIMQHRIYYNIIM